MQRVGAVLSMCDDKQTIEIGNLLKITKVYLGLLKFMANIAVLLKSALGSVMKCSKRGVLFLDFRYPSC